MTDTLPTSEGITILEPLPPRSGEILTQDAQKFLADLERNFRNQRKNIHAFRLSRQENIYNGEMPDFFKDTEHIRESSWTVADTPPDLLNRRVEITGPTDRKMVINAMNSGANVFMADFEDANSPTWFNMIDGQANLKDAVRREISYQSPDGREYLLQEQPVVLMVRPRGWHLVEKHFLVDGEPISGALFDFGLYFFHNARELISRGSGPYFYLAKLESHIEAKLWNDVFTFAQQELEIPHGTIRATVLIETILAAFEMDEILFELRDHAAGLNAGRWDYIFSIIKKFNRQPGFIFPDRSQITMTTPFMRAYTDLLVKTCHHRGAFAMGGMAAFIPSRKDEEINQRALAKVREDKLRESKDGFDGTWVAHPDLVPVARDVFDKALGDNPNQKHILRNDVDVKSFQLLDFSIHDGFISLEGFSLNISVALQYLAAWLAGRGAVGIYNLMEDTATAEISRSQLWQWLSHPDTNFKEGHTITPSIYNQVRQEELTKVKHVYANAAETFQFDLAAKLLDQLVLSQDFIEFLTLIGYDELE
jgi:malate synthase